MNLGIKQKCLLRRCAVKGYLSISDVLRYYSFSGSSKCFGKLEALELLGYLKAEGRNRYTLTKKGIEFVEGLKSER